MATSKLELENFIKAVATDEFASIVAQHMPPAGVVYKYGTAGFRMKAELLPCAVFRTGLLATLRSASLGGKRVGVMITASHNPLPDNGVKIVDASGAMLGQKWEDRAATLANLPATEVAGFLGEIAKECLAAPTEDGHDCNHGARVVVARDTRPSGPGLAAVLDAGVSLCAGSVVDLGELTTPQLHWVVSALNTHDSGLSAVVTGASEIGYYGAVADAFAALVAGTEASDAACAAPWPPALSIDAANGVGGMAAHRLAAVLGPRLCEVAVRNDGSAPADVLNEGCGSDHVKSGQCAPKGVELPAGSARLFASFDGDADRVVCYRRAADGAFRLLDGDKILTLFAVFVIKMLKAAGIREFVKVLCVQTAYANGASTAYLRDTLAVETDFTATGVKNLHHRALECDGVSVYFEANGHGTVLFGQGFRRALLLANPALDDAAGHAALRALRAFSALINPHVGDAITDALGVLGVLCSLGWTPEQWDALYEDLPNSLDKCAVKDRSMVTTSHADTRCVTPAALQPLIDAAVAAAPQPARSFVRASGTEDVVRVYAEAGTAEGARELCAAVKALVVKHCS